MKITAAAIYSASDQKGISPEKGRKTGHVAGTRVLVSSDGGLDLEVAECGKLGHI